MTEFDWVQCPDCGWTGRQSELAGDETRDTQTCPSCGAAVRID